jgi:hypothetical protein
MHRIGFAALLGALTLLVVPFAHATSGGLVVSQVYAGGGNTGATYANDFVELLNRGTTAVDLTGWTVQYASSTSTSWQPTTLSGSIQPGRYYLVQLASAGAVGAALPTPDATGTTNLASAGGKVAVVHDTAALTCGAAAGSCASVSTIADFVGYGSASDYEGLAAAPALTSTTAATRAGGGCTDTDSNGADFTAAAPTPRASAAPAAACGGSSPSGTNAAASVAVDVEPLISIALERTSISFGQIVPGETPPTVSEHVTVVSNDTAGYSLTAHRTAFAPADLPLAIAPSPTGTLTALPIAPAADVLLAGASAASGPSGDIWPVVLGLLGPAPVVASGHYTATVTFTVIGR